MTVTFPEHINGAAGGFSSTYSGGTTPLTIVSPAAGDVLILRITQVRSGIKVTSVAGCGATWAKVANNAHADEQVQFWRGTGTLSAGTVTATANGSTWAQGSLTLVRGLTADTVVADDGTTTNTASGDDPGPILSAANGQAVFATAYSSLMDQYPSATTAPDPATGWTFDAIVSAATGFESATGRRIPASTANHQVTAHNSNSANGYHLLIVLGDENLSVEITPPAATATADAPLPVVAASTSPPVATATATAVAPVVAVNIQPPAAAAAAATPASPSVELIPQQAYFEPPTYQEAVRDHFWGRYSIPVGQSVVKIDGTFTIRPYPWLGEIAPLEQGVEWFQGGRKYPITEAVAAELEADGFTVTHE